MHVMVVEGQHLVAMTPKIISRIMHISQVLFVADPCLSVQVQNASDLLIKPLEKFRKEQLGVTKVSLWVGSGEANGDTTFNTFLTYLHCPTGTLEAASSNLCVNHLPE